MRPANTLFICSDQHNPSITGCYGDSKVQTPNLDRLAARGTRFTNAYTPSPICVPARACMATGRYVHRLETWDNAAPYTGQEAESWGQRLTEQGHNVTTIGKLHYRSEQDSTGFPDQRIPMHIVQGKGNIYGLLREKMPPLPQFRKQIVTADTGESDYTTYDRAVTQHAVQWIKEEARQHTLPWTLSVSFTLPHPPFMIPAQYLEMYLPDEVPLRPNWQQADWSQHSEIAWLRKQQQLTEPFSEATIRRATALYYGMVTFMDEQIGTVLDALEAAGLQEATRVIYTSDHGEMLGEHGLWFKCCMHEGSARVPLIIAGPDIAEDAICKTNTSLVDLFPTLVESVGAQQAAQDHDLPGESLLQIAQQNYRDRTVFSEFHAALSRAGMYMLRNARWKYVYYVGAQAQLFDLDNDPGENHDLAADPTFRDILQACELELRSIVDPEAVDRQAHNNQQIRLAITGGVEALLQAGFTTPFSPPPNTTKQ